MMRLRSTLRRLQEPCDIFVPPGTSLTRPDLQPVQLVGDPPQRFASLPEPVNPLQDGLFARLRFHVALVGGLPVAIRRVAHEFQLRLLVAHRVPRPLSNGFPLPLADRDHDVKDQPAGGAAGIQGLGDRDQRDAPALELLQQDGQVLHGAGQPVQFGDDHHSHGPRLDHFKNANHARPVEILGALTGVNNHVQKLDIVNRCHCPNLLDLRFQRNAPVGLLVCRNPHVTNPFCFHILKKLDHTSGGSHKLSGYRFRSTSVWKTHGENRRGSAPPAHGQQPPPSTQVSGRPWRRCRVCGLSLVLVGSRARQPRLPGVSSVGWRQRRVCPDAPHRKSPARPGSNTSDTGNNVLPHKKRGGKLSGSSSRGLPSLGPASFLRSALPRNAVGASVGWRRLAPRRAEASTRSQRQRRQLVHRNLAAVLVIRGGWSGCFGTDAPCSLRYAYHKEKTMTNRLLLGTLLLFAGTGFAAQTWTGKISDSDCGAKHKSAAEHGGKAMSDHDCAVACVKGGAKYVFVTGGKVYPVNNQDFSGLEEHAGHTVKLTGDMQSQGGINVTGVQMTSAKKK